MAGLAVASLYAPARAASTFTLSPSVTSGTVSWDQGSTYLGGVKASGADNSVDFSENVLTGPLTLTLDNSQTIGNLIFGDQGNAFDTIVRPGAGGSLTLATSTGTPTVAVTNRTATISAVFAGTSGLNKTGTGNLVLTAANTLTGPVAISGGQLALDYSQGAGAAGTVILQSSSPMVLAGGTLNVIGSAGSSVSQSFASTALNAGASSIIATSASASDSLFLSLGTITRNVGGTVNFTEPLGTLSSNTNGIAAGNSNTNGILSGWATVGGTEWASVNGSGLVVPLSTVGSYETTTAGGTTLSNYVNANTDVTSTLTLASLATNSLRFNTAAAETLTLTGTNVVSSGGILVAPTVGNKASKIAGGTLEGAAGADLVVIQNNTASGLTITSIIADNGSATGLTKSGAGTLTLSGANTYTGPTNINGGTVAVSGAGATLGSVSTVTINGGALSIALAETVGSLNLVSGSITGNFKLTSTNTINVQSGSVSSNLASANGLSKTGAGTVLLSGANTYTGATTIAAGTLQIPSIGSTAAAAQPLGSAAAGISIVLGSGTTAGTLEYTGTGAATLTRQFSLLGGAGGGIKNSGGAALTLTGAIDLAAKPLTLTGGAITISKALTDSTQGATPVLNGAGLLINGAQVTITVAADKFFGGSVTVTGGGTLIAGVNATFTTAPTFTLGEAVTNTGGTLDLNGGNVSVNFLSNAGTGQALITNSGAALHSITTSGASTFSGTIEDGSGGVQFIKAGGGALTLSGVQSYTGGTIVRNGTITLVGGVDNRIASGTSLTLGNGTNSNAILQLGNAAGASNQTVSSITNSLGTAGVNTIVGGNASSISTLTVNTVVNDIYSGNLGSTTAASKALALVKTGPATLTLSGVGTNTGGTSVQQGTLALGNASALAATGAVTIGGGSLDLAGFIAATGPVTLTSGSIVDSIGGAALNATGFTVLSGSISAGLGGAGVLTKTGPGTVTLGGTNSYSGGTSIQQGTLVLGGAGALLATGAVTLQGGTLDVAGHGISTGNVTLTNGSIVNSGASAALTAPSFSLQSGSIAVALAGIGSTVTKDSPGIVTLAGANTYTGDTTVNAGALNLSAASTGGGNFTVGDSASLGVSLGAAGQTLAASSLTLGANKGATLSLDLGRFGNPSVPVVAAGTLTLNGTDLLNISGAGLSLGLFPLLSYQGSLGGGGFSALALGTLPARVTANLVNDTAGSQIELQITAFDVPRWSGAVNGNWDIDDGTGTVGTLNFKLSGGAATGYYQSAATGTDSVLFDDSATGTTTVQLTTVLTPGTVTVNNATKNYTFAGPGKLSGGTSLIKQGAGTLSILTSGNDYTGTTTVEGGLLVASDGVTPGAGQLGTGDLILTAGTLALDRTVSDDYTLANLIRGLGSLLQMGSDTVTLAGNDGEFQGTLTVQAGTVRVGSVNALGTAAVTVSPGGTLDLASFNLANTLQLGGTLKIAVGVSDTDTADVTVSSSPSFSVPAGSTLTLAGTLGGTGGFTKSDLGTLVLTGTDTYTGLANIAAGTLQVGSAAALGSAPDGVSVQPGAVLDLAGFAVSEPVALNGGTLRSSIGTGGGLSGGVTLNTASTVDVPTGVSLALAGPVSGSGLLTKTGAGLLSLNGPDSFGGLAVNAGTILFNNASALPTGAPVSLSAGTTAAFGFAFTQAHLSQIVPTTGAVTIALGIDNANDLNFTGLPAASLGALGTARYSGHLTPAGNTYLLGGGGGNLTVSSVLRGSFGLTVGSTGAGTVTLTGANTFAGTVTVAAGLLQVGNPQALGAALNPVALTGGTLDLNGNSLALGNLSAGATGVLTDNSTAPGTTVLTVYSTATTTFSGGILDGANGRAIMLVKDGPGEFLLNKANGSTYSGGTILNAGILDVRANNVQVLPLFSNVTFTGTATLLAENNGTTATATGSLVLGDLAFQYGDGTVTNSQLNASTSQTVTFSSVPTRLPGATGDFTVGGTATDPTLYKFFLFTATPPTVAQSLDGGLFFNYTDGNKNLIAGFATYDLVGGFLRPLKYDGTDAGAAAVGGGQSWAGVTGKDVQLTAGTGDITAQTTDTIRTLSLPGANNLTLDNTSGAILTISAGGILKSGSTATTSTAATISGGAGITTGGARDLVVRTDQPNDMLTIATPILPSTLGGLTKTGPGTLVLTGSNTYGGSTWVNAGVLRANDGVGLASGPLILDSGVLETGQNFFRSLGTGTGQVQLSGAAGFSAFGANVTLDLSGNSAGSAYALRWGAPGFNPTILTLNTAQATATLALANTLDLNGAVRTIAVNAAVANLAGPVVGAAGSSLIKTGTGVLLLSAANQLPGGFTVSAGTLRVGNPAAFGTSPVTVNAATLDLNGFSVTAGPLAANATGIVTDSSAGAGATTLTEYVGAGQSATFSGGIVDGANKTVAVVKDGPGTWILNKASGNTYSGGTFLNAGVLDVRTNNASVLKSGSALTFEGAATFRAANGGAATGTLTLGTVTFAAADGAIESNQLSTGLAQTLTLAAAPTRLPGATGTFTLVTATDPSKYKVTFATAASPGRSLDGGLYFGGSDFAAYDAGNYVRALNYLSDTNAANIVLAGDQTTLGTITGKDVQLSGSGNITGQTTDTVRSLKIVGAQSITLDNPTTATVTISGGGLLKTGGGLAVIAGGGGITTGGSGDLVVRTDGLSDNLRIDAVILGSTTGGLTKTGAGTLSLSAAEGYSGETTVNAGTLIVSGSISGSTLVRNGGTLGGTGSLADVTIGSGGTLEGSLDVTSLTLDNGSTLSLSLGETIVSTGVIDLNGNINLTLALNTTPNPGDTFSLFNGADVTGYDTGGRLDWQGTVLNDGDTFTASAGGVAQQFEVSYSANGGNAVAIIAVPEPGTWATLLSGVGMLAFRRRGSARQSVSRNTAIAPKALA